MIKARPVIAISVATVLLAGFAAAPAYVSAVESETENEALLTTGEDVTSTSGQDNEARLERIRQAKEKYSEQTQELLEKARERQRNAGLVLAARKKTCEERKPGLLVRTQRIATNGARHLELINGVFDKAVAFQEEQQLNVSNYDELATAATEAKAKAVASVQALADLKPSDSDIDCTTTSAAEQVAAFKAAAAQARADIKAYKTSVKAILAALRTAKEAAQEQEGGEQ